MMYREKIDSLLFEKSKAVISDDLRFELQKYLNNLNSLFESQLCDDGLTGMQRRVLEEHQLQESEYNKLVISIEKMSSDEAVKDCLKGYVRNNIAILRVLGKMGLDVSSLVSDGLSLNKNI